MRADYVMIDGMSNVLLRCDMSSLIYSVFTYVLKIMAERVIYNTKYFAELLSKRFNLSPFYLEYRIILLVNTPL